MRFRCSRINGSKKKCVFPREATLGESYMSEWMVDLPGNGTQVVVNSVFRGRQVIIMVVGIFKCHPSELFIQRKKDVNATHCKKGVT